MMRTPRVTKNHWSSMNHAISPVQRLSLDGGLSGAVFDVVSRSDIFTRSSSSHPG